MSLIWRTPDSFFLNGISNVKAVAPAALVLPTTILVQRIWHGLEFIGVAIRGNTLEHQKSPRGHDDVALTKKSVVLGDVDCDVLGFFRARRRPFDARRFRRGTTGPMKENHRETDDQIRRPRIWIGHGSHLLRMYATHQPKRRGPRRRSEVGLRPSRARRQPLAESYGARCLIPVASQIATVACPAIDR